MWPADPLPSQLFTGPVLTSPADQLSVSRSLGQCSRDQLISYQVSCSLAQCSGDQLISYQVSCSLGQSSCDQLISYQSAVHWASVQVTSWSATRSAVHWVSVHVTSWSATSQLFTGSVFMWPTDQPSVSCSLGQCSCDRLISHPSAVHLANRMWPVDHSARYDSPWVASDIKLWRPFLFGHAMNACRSELAIEPLVIGPLLWEEGNCRHCRHCRRWGSPAGAECRWAGRRCGREGRSCPRGCPMFHGVPPPLNCVPCGRCTPCVHTKQSMLIINIYIKICNEFNCQ